MVEVIQADVAKLVERLRYRYPAGGLRNPDGPEAADTITSLQATVVRLEAALTGCLEHLEWSTPQGGQAYVEAQDVLARSALSNEGEG